MPRRFEVVPRQTPGTASGPTRNGVSEFHWTDVGPCDVEIVDTRSALR